MSALFTNDFSNTENNFMDIESWSKGIAELAIDALVDAAMINKEDIERAEAIVAEEIFVRLVLGDYPPPPPSVPL